VLRVVVRVEGHFPPAAVDGGELGMIDPELSPVNEHEPKRPERLTADRLRELVRCHKL